MRTSFFGALVVAGLGSTIVAHAAVPTSLSPLIGSWSGNGTIKLETGQTEVVKCKAYYTERGNLVGVALRCASSASKIDLRATIGSTGARLTGTWEERQFNANGQLSGSVSGNRLSLDMDGGGVKANIVVATTGGNQTLSIVAEVGGFKSVSIAFARD